MSRVLPSVTSDGLERRTHGFEGLARRGSPRRPLLIARIAMVLAASLLAGAPAFAAPVHAPEPTGPSGVLRYEFLGPLPYGGTAGLTDVRDRVSDDEALAFVPMIGRPGELVIYDCVLDRVFVVGIGRDSLRMVGAFAGPGKRDSMVFMEDGCVGQDGTVYLIGRAAWQGPGRIRVYARPGAADTWTTSDPIEVDEFIHAAIRGVSLEVWSTLRLAMEPDGALVVYGTDRTTSPALVVARQGRFLRPTERTMRPPGLAGVGGWTVRRMEGPDLRVEGPWGQVHSFQGWVVLGMDAGARIFLRPGFEIECRRIDGSIVARAGIPRHRGIGRHSEGKDMPLVTPGGELVRTGFDEIGLFVQRWTIVD